jgi:hypothetical protein
MALDTELRAITYAGNASTSLRYDITFPYLEAADVRVQVQATGAATPTVLTTAQYTVHEPVGASAYVTTAAAYPSTTTVQIFRFLNYLQPLVLPEGGKLSSVTLEQSLDRLTMLAAQAGDGGFSLPSEGVMDTAIWANDVARTTEIPKRLGQLGVQTNNNTVYIAQSLAAGDWTIYPNPADEVLTQAEGDDRYVSRGSGGVTVAERTGIYWHGQSLSVGADGNPIAHISAVHNHLTFATGPNNPVGAALDSSAALFERPVSNQGETPCSSMASGITQRRLAIGEDDLVVFSATAGVGGSSITGLVYGTAPYTRLVSYDTNARELAVAAGKTYTTSAVCWLQGETDAAASMSQSTYFAAFSGLANRITLDMAAVTLTYQTTAYIMTSNGVALAQLQADSLDNVHLVTPIYFVPLAFGSNIHPSAAGYQEIGFRFARAWSDLLERRQVQRIRFVEAVQEGALRVVVYFDVPTAPLVLNTTRVPALTNHGFKLVDTTGTVPFTSITISGTKVIFLASRPITGALQVRYGLDYTMSTWINGAGGNLTDSTTDSVWINGTQQVLQHWCPAFTATATRIDSPNFPQPTAGPETTAYEHWVLKVNSSSLTGIVNTRSLVPVATVNYNANAVVCPAGLAGFVNGLKTDLIDRQSYTIGIVFKRPAVAPGDYTIFAGTPKVSAEDGAGILEFGNTPLQMTVVSPGVSFGRLWADGAVAVGDWVWAAFVSNGGKVGGMIGGGSYLEDATVRTVTSREIGVGNCYVPFSNADNLLEIAEVVLFDSTLTPTQLNELYARSQSRLLARGLTI